MKYVWILFLLLWGQQIAWAQQPLRVGDICPDIHYTYYRGGRSMKKSLYENRDKWIILDFWASYCSGCVAGLVDLESLSNEFGDRLHVVPIATEAKDKVTRFWDKNEVTQGLHMGTALGGGLFDDLFPRGAVPHYVILDPRRRVVAITYQEYVHSENVRKLLDGQTVPFADKTIHAPGEQTTDLQESDDIIVESAVCRYNPQVEASTGRLQLDTIGSRVHLKISNNSIYDLYLKALEPKYILIPKLRLIDGVDSTLLFYDRNKSGYQIDWIKNNTFGYEISAPLDMTVAEMKAKMINDLNFSFRLSGRIVPIERAVWELRYNRQIGATGRDDGVGGISIKVLITLLNKQMNIPYIMDTIVDCPDGLFWNIGEILRDSSKDEVRIWLMKNGFEVIEKVVPIDHFVLAGQ